MADGFCARAQSRFSAFFHGQSVLVREIYRTPQVGAKAANSCRPHRPMARGGFRRDGPGTRSHTSTRSLIDPISSPNSSAGSPHPEDFWQYRGAFFTPVSPLAPSPRDASRRTGETNDHPAQRARSSRRREPRKKRGCFSAVEDHQIRRKMIASLISGTLLILLLTICEWLTGNLIDPPDGSPRSRARSLQIDPKYQFPRGHDRLCPGPDDGLLPFRDSTFHAECPPSRSRAASLYPTMQHDG